MADKDMVDDEREDERDEADESVEEAKPARGAVATAVKPPGRGFLSTYKPGQGYWTRMGTAVALAVVVFSLALFIYEPMGTWGAFQKANQRPNAPLILGVIGAVILVISLVAWRILNRVGVVDFLIATESEMKKVNWTTKKELIGSTKVVIIFMFLIAMILFVIDVGFGFFFKLIRVLKFGPFDNM